VHNRWHRRCWWMVGAVLATAVAVPLALMGTAATVSSATHGSSAPAANTAATRYLSHISAPMDPAGPHPAAGPDNATDSFNWSGYVDLDSKKGSFTQASASWTVPAITCTQEDQIASEWVGFDGETDRTVEQVGTLGQCFEGSAIYYDWYEMYPAGTVVEHQMTAPGDQVTATISRSGTSYTLSIADSTNAADGFTATASCSAAKCKDTSAEWIAERPTYRTTGLTPLVDFGTWNPGNASVTSGGTVGNIDSFNPEAVTMIDSTGTYDLDTVTTGATTGFTATWKDSY
jgi:hypothetical protein